MAVVTGTLRDFSLAPIAARSPRIIFTASSPSTLVDRVFSAAPIVVNPAADGSFSVNLQPTDVVMPAVFYTIRVEWLDSAGGFVGLDLLDWPLYVPAAGGVIGDLLRVPANPSQVWIDIEQPRYPTRGLWWLVLNPDDPFDPRGTGDLFQWV